MSRQACAFTIIEILVASSLFMMLMGVAAFSFQRLNEGGRYAQKIVELHQRSDAIIRMLEEDLRMLQQTVAVHIDKDSDPNSFTFMRQITNYTQQGFGGNDLVSSITGIGQEQVHWTDLIWVKWEWGNGDFRRGNSRSHHVRTGWTGDRRYTDNTRQYLKHVNFKVRGGTDFHGMHRNGIPAIPQKYFVHYYGNGNFVGVNNDGSTNARPGDQIRVYKKIAASDFDGNETLFFDKLTSPWLSGDYSHWYTTYMVGNDEMLSDEAFAVCNRDGLTFNKDRLNLEGSDDHDGNDNYYYPSQMEATFSGVEYMTIDFLKRNGQEISSADDDDTISDGATTIDINGIADDASGAGIDKRPVNVRVSFLLHSLDQNEIDVSDYDTDGDTDEYLVQAVRDAVSAEGLSTRAEEIEAFRRHCRELAGSSVVVNYTIKLSL